MVTLALRRVCCALLPLMLLAGGVARSRTAASQNPQSPLTVAADEFVREILARSGSPAAVTVTFQNVSGVGQDAIEAAQTAIFNSFRNTGIRLVKPEMAVAEVEITLSDDWQNNDWIALIHEGSSSQMVIKKFPRLEAVATAHSPILTLRKYTFWQQNDPILDFFADDRNLALLEPDQISLYVNDSGQWRGRFTLGIPHAQPWPRDLRGRLEVKDGRITAFLPGTMCTGRISPPELDCRPSDDPWQLDQGQMIAFYSPRRNFFTGILAGPNAGASVLPFFSAAARSSGEQRQWIFAGTDGHARLYVNDLSAPATLFNAWGSNLAALNSRCGSGWQLLVTTPSDSIHADAIQAIEISGREAQPVSAPIDLSGPVSAMWTAGKNGETVNAIMHSAVTEKYEAFALSVSCN